MADPIFKMNPCSSCDARCCRKYLVAVVPSDVLRISKRFGKKPEEFLNPFPAQECNCAWAIPFWIGGKEYYLGLKRENGRCVFLTLENRCSIHKFKPLVCSTFPFLLDGEKAVKSNACPKEWTNGEEKLEKLNAYHSELKEMRRRIVEWDWHHSKEGDFEKLMAFLLQPK